MASLAFLGLERAWRRRRACPKQRCRRWNSSAGAPSVLEVTSTQLHQKPLARTRTGATEKQGVHRLKLSWLTYLQRLSTLNNMILT